MFGAKSEDTHFRSGVGNLSARASLALGTSTKSNSLSIDDASERLLFAENTEAGVQGDVISVDDAERLEPCLLYTSRCV